MNRAQFEQWAIDSLYYDGDRFTTLVRLVREAFDREESRSMKEQAKEEK